MRSDFLNIANKFSLNSYVLKSSFWLNLNSVTSSIVTLVISILFANYVSQETYGVYRYLLSIASIAAAFSLTGMNTSVTRSVAQGFTGIFKKSLIEQLKWSLPQVIITLSIAIYYFAQNNYLYGIGLTLISILSPVSNIANTFSAVLNGKKSFKKLAIYSSISNIFYLLILGTAIIWFSNSYVLLVLFFYIPTVICNLIFCYLTYKKENSTTDKNYREEDITYAKHMSLMNVVSNTISQIDNILIYHLLGPASLAIFNFATLIPEKIRSLFGFTSQIAFPRIAEQKFSGSVLIKKSNILMMVAIGIAVLYFFSAPYIFEIFFPQYLSSVVYSQFFAISLIAIASNITFTALQAQKRQKDLYIISFGVPIVRLVFTVSGIIYFGIWGAIFARMSSHIMLWLASVFFLSRIEKTK